MTLYSLQSFINQMRKQDLAQLQLKLDGVRRFQEDLDFGDSAKGISVKNVQIRDAKQDTHKVYFTDNNTLVGELKKKYVMLPQCKGMKTNCVYLTTTDGKQVMDDQKICKYYLPDRGDQIQFLAVNPNVSQLKASQAEVRYKKDQYLSDQLQQLQRESSDSGCSDTSSDQQIYKNLQQVEQSQFKIQVSFKNQPQEQLQFVNVAKKEGIVSKVKDVQFINVAKKEGIVSKVKNSQNAQQAQKNTSTKQSIRSSKSMGRDNKKIILKYGPKQKIIINYDKYRNCHIKTVILHMIPYSRPTYCLKFKHSILMPDERFSKIQEFAEFSNRKLKFKVIRCYEKFAYYIKMQQCIEKFNLKLLPVKILQKLNQQQLNEETFPILRLYTMTNLYIIMQNHLRNQNCLKKTAKLQSLCINFNKSLQNLTNYIGNAHRVLLSFRFGEFYKKGDCYCWRSIVSATKNEKVVEDVAKKSNGSLVHIKSLNGKDLSSLSCSPQQQQIVFMSYSYFIIDKIKIGNDYDEVWVSQMPSVLQINHKIILWVDDKISKHEQLILKICKKDPQIQIFKISSTNMLKIWIDQFWSMVEHYKIKLKVVTNMKRQQQGKPNFYAGVDVIEYLGSRITQQIQILVYCKDKQRAEKNIEQRKVKYEKYRVEKAQKQLIKFCINQKI